MDLPFYSAVTAIFACCAAAIAGHYAYRVAQLNVDKEMVLQNTKLKDDRLKDQRAIEREQLDKLHRTVSKIAFENSLTMSHFHSSANLSVPEFRVRYLGNCDRLHDAMAIADLYYPSMSETFGDIYGQMNVFWGYQENLLRTDINTEQQRWASILEKVIGAGNAIGQKSDYLKKMISAQALVLNQI